MASLSGKVYAITGGASGIGLATAKQLSQRGATVCIADISAASLAAADAAFKEAPHSTTQVDVSQRSQVDAWIAGIVAQFGRLDGAANIAGVIGPNHARGTIADLDDDEWHRIIAVNLTGCMYCLRAELRAVERGGSIANMASIHGVNAMALNGAYGASKHGVVGLTKAAAKENGDREVRVNAVAPGAVSTPMMQQALQQLGGEEPDSTLGAPSAIKRQGTPDEIAAVIVFLLGPESSFVSGSIYGADGAWL